MPDPATDPRSDDELVDALNDGESAAFDALYHRHKDWVGNLALRITGDRELALDVLQETFLYLARKFPGFTLTAKLRTFLYPVVRNNSLTALKKARRYVSGEHLAETEAASPEPVSPDNQRDQLAAALQAISGEHREVLLLRFVDGMSLAEIGEALSIPLGTVKSRLHNALATLRKDERVKRYFA